MLCYRCGSYNADGSRKCDICGQSFSDRRTTGRSPALAVAGTPKNVAPFEPGALIADRYRVAEAVAQGTSGWVLRARDEEIDVDVAVKVIAAHLLQTDGERTRFTKMLRRAQKVQHPNVARIYDHGRDGPYVFYTMPFLEGLTLRKIIDLRAEKRQVFAPEETFPLIIQLAAAVDNLGKFGPHGAMRPSCVVVLPDLLKITALAHLRGLPTLPYVAAQTTHDAAEYLAPEVRRGAAEIDRRADVYSLAMITAEMLTGHRFSGDPSQWSEVSQALPPRLVSVLSRGLSDAPENRPATGEALFKAMVTAAEGGDAPVPLEHHDTPTPALLGGEVDDFVVVEPGALVEESTSPEGRPTPPPPPPDAVAELPAIPLESVAEAGAGGPTPMRPLTTPVPLTKRRTTHRTTQNVRRPKSAIGKGRPRAPLTGGVMRTRKGGSRSGLMLGLAILLAGISVSAAIWYQRQQGVQEPRAPIAGQLENPEVSDPSGAGPEATGEGTGDSGSPAGPSEPSAPGERPSSPKSQPVVATASQDPRREPRDSGRSPPQERTPTRVAKMETPPVEAQPKEAPPPKDPDPAPKEVAVVVPEPADTPARVKQSVCPNGMIKVAAGSFLMGTPAGDPLRGFGDLSPRRKQLEAYCIDIYEYPNQRGKRPVTSVSWGKAKAMCEKQGKRLCTESEWEMACKGPANLRFPTGNRLDDGVCNSGGEGKKLSVAGAYSNCRSTYGVVDMAGNVAEWTSGRWSPDIDDKVVKGGSADQATYTARCSARANESAGAAAATLGFRCCKSLD